MAGVGKKKGTDRTAKQRITAKRRKDAATRKPPELATRSRTDRAPGPGSSVRSRGRGELPDTSSRDVNARMKAFANSKLSPAQKRIMAAALTKARKARSTEEG